MYTPTKLANRFFIFVWIIGFALHIGQDIFNSSMTVFANNCGYSNTFAGSLSFGYLAGALVGRMAGGRITDTISRRACMLIGTGMFFLGSVLLCLPIAQNGFMMMLFRIFQGFGYSSATTGYFVAAVDVVPKEKAPIALGINFTGQSCAFVITSVLMVAITFTDSFTMLFVLTTACVAVSVLFSFFMKYEGGNARKPKEVKKTKGALIEKSSLPFAGIVLIYYSGVALPVFYIVPLALSKGISSGNYVFAFIGIGMLVGYLVYPRIAERFSAFAGMLPIYALGFTGLLMAAFTDSEILFPIAGAFFGSGIASVPIMQNAATEHLPANRKGAGTATLNLALDLTMGVSPMIWGILIDSCGYSLPFVIGAILYPSAMVVHFFLDRHIKHKNAQLS